MLTRLAIRIQEHLDALTPSERALASFILDNQHLVVGLSAAELAREAGTSKSTAVRFFRTLGYESFEAVRLQARGELNRLQPGGQWAGPPEIVPPAGSPAAFLSQEMASLARTLEGLSSEALRLATERLAGAERIWIGAFEEDAALGRLALGLLSPLRPGVDLIADGVTPIFNKLVSVGPRDTLLLVTLGKRADPARFAIEQAESAGCSLVVVTNLWQQAPLGSPVMMRCHAAPGASGGSATAAVSVLQLLARQLAARLGERATGRQALIASLREAADDHG